MSSDADTRTLAALLDWYRAMGADTATSDAAVDWLARGDTAPGAGYRLARDEVEVSEARGRTPDKASPRLAPDSERARSTAAGDGRSKVSDLEGQRPITTLPEPRRFPAQPPDAAETAARSAARQAQSLGDLEEALRAFDGCALKATAKNLCFYRGAAKARVMLIGEAPGRDEDLEGKPFVGRAGRLLDKMLGSIKLSEADVHITNIVYWRPPGNRTPTPQEAQICRPFLERQIDLVEPELLVLLGGAAAKHVLDVAEGIMRIRGKWRETEAQGRKIKTIATLHPAYLLRTPAAKRLAWRDLLAVSAALKRGG